MFLQIMKASLFTEDEEESDMFQDHRAMKVSTDVSSPRLVLPGAQSRPSGTKGTPVHFLKRDSISILSMTGAIINMN